MAKLSVFMSVTLNGYFADLEGGLSWAHRQDSEWDDFVAGNASGGGTLVFGRVTYEMMEQYWPTSMAYQNQPVVAEQMNNRPKIVFSRTLERATWNNTRLVKGDPAAAMQKIKEESDDMVILGSGSIVTQLAEAGLVDEFQIVVCPVVLSAGRPLFGGIKDRLDLKLIDSRSFSNGNVFLRYGAVGG